MAFQKYSGEVTGQTTSQALLAGEKDPTEMGKADFIRGHKRVDLAEVASKVLIPGEKVRGQAEMPSDKEVVHGG